MAPRKATGVEVIEETEVGDAEDFSLHLPLTVGGDQRELRLERLHHRAGIHAFGNGDGGCRCGRGCGREKRETESNKSGARGGGVDLRIVDQGYAALFKIATGLSGDVVERGAEAGDQRNSRGVSAFALDGVLALLAKVEIVAWIF